MVRPNGPRPSQHRLIIETDQRARFGMRRVAERAWPPLAGLSWPHPRWARYDLIHSFNAIPITSKPWLVTFESVLPRTLGTGGAELGRRLRERLDRDTCRGLIAMSHYARGKFMKANQDWVTVQRVLPKVTVVYPHFETRAASVRRYARGEVLRLVFVGNDFARKGGVVALRAVARASAAGLPVRLDIVSGFRVGAPVYTDHAAPGRYDADLKLLAHAAVTVHGRLPNDQVLALMAEAHVQLLPTMDDTFGYSVVEGYSVGTPAIVTSVCAMPELVAGDSGALIDLPVDEWGNWVGLPATDAVRGGDEYWGELTETYDAMAEQLVEELTGVVDAPAQIERWSTGALARFQRNHESGQASAKLDALYDAALRGAPLGVDRSC
jgi:glycosyltransferase involved in cell wall biosynthesis